MSVKFSGLDELQKQLKIRTVIQGIQALQRLLQRLVQKQLLLGQRALAALCPVPVFSILWQSRV